MSELPKELQKRMAEKHIEFATKVYHHTFDETKMSREEIESQRSQIRTLGIVPFNAGAQALWSELEPILRECEDSLNKCNIHLKSLGYPDGVARKSQIKLRYLLGESDDKAN